MIAVPSNVRGLLSAGPSSFNVSVRRSSTTGNLNTPIRLPGPGILDARPLLPVRRATMEIVNLKDKMRRVQEYWSPKIVGELNDTYVKVVKLRGEFVWHHHEREDELFLVVEGRLRMQLRDGNRDLGPGEFIIVPRGVEHCPKALTDEVHVVLIEPQTTLNTGNVVNERTVRNLERIRAHKRGEAPRPCRDGHFVVFGRVSGGM